MYEWIIKNQEGKNKLFIEMLKDGFQFIGVITADLVVMYLQIFFELLILKRTVHITKPQKSAIPLSSTRGK